MSWIEQFKTLPKNVAVKAKNKRSIPLTESVVNSLTNSFFSEFIYLHKYKRMDISFVFVYQDKYYESYFARYINYLVQNIDKIAVLVLNDNIIDILVIPDSCSDVPTYIDKLSFSNIKYLRDIIILVIIPDEEKTTGNYVNKHFNRYLEKYQEKIENIFLAIFIKESDYDYTLNNLVNILQSIIF